MRTRSPKRVAFSALHVVWRVDRSPGLHSSRTYSPTEVGTWSGPRSCSNPVPPEGKRTKRFAIDAVRWEPGRKDRAPFFRVHFSRAIQKPSAVGGDVYWFRVSGADQNREKSVGRHTRKVL
jgi:hypothetical protein